MKKRGLSQEWLKLIACISMLIDHVGAVFFPDVVFLRILGRAAFPIYCFLLVEGICHTGNPRRYAGRLALGAIVSELPFDLLFWGVPTLAHQSVMLTLLLGFCMAQWMRHSRLRILPLLLCGLAAEFLQTDYGITGILIIYLFLVTRDIPHRILLQGILLGLICWTSNSAVLTIRTLRIPIEFFAVAAMVPIAAYSGEKRSRSPHLQRAFYLFYPVHMCVLLLIRFFS